MGRRMMRATSTWLFCQRGGVCATRPHRRRGGCSIQGVRFVRGQAAAASERFAGGVALLQRSGTATGRARAGPNRVLCAPAAGCDAQRVGHLAGGRGRPGREPGHARAALNRRQKKSVHAVERVRALAGGLSRSGASGICHLFQIRGRGEHEHGLLPPLRPCRG